MIHDGAQVTIVLLAFTGNALFLTSVLVCDENLLFSLIVNGIAVKSPTNYYE